MLAGVVEASARTLNVEASARALNVEASVRTVHEDGPAADRNGTLDWNRAGVESASAAESDFARNVLPANTSVNVVESDEPPATDGAIALRGQGAVIEASSESSRPTPEAPLIPEILDAKAAEVRAIEAKVADLLGVFTRPNHALEAQEAKLAPEPHQARTVESKAVPMRAVESRAVEIRAIESKRVANKAVETKALESKPVESKAVESPAVGSPAAQPAASDPEERQPALAKLSRMAPPYRIATPSTAANAIVNSGENTDFAPGLDAREPALPSLIPPAPESLNALLAASGMLDDEPLDPPLSAGLPLPLPPVRLMPRAPVAVSLPGSTTEIVLPREAASEHKIAGLALAESPFPLGCIAARPMKAAPAMQPTALPPKSVGVRAPRSPRPLLAPEMAALVKYSPLENHPLRPAPPPEDLRTTQTAPRFTLPGPMLTRSLASFQDRALTPIFLEERAFRKRLTSGWLVTVLVVGTVLGVGFSSLFSLHSGADARPTAVAERSSPDAASASDTTDVADKKNPAAAHATGSNPLSKSIEVTGFRIVIDPSRKAEVQYLVVNHSPARLSDATVYVTLHAANARPGQPPLCRFSFAAPSLGPFEAKEMISAIEKTNRPVNLPDWQALRADVEIGQ